MSKDNKILDIFDIFVKVRTRMSDYIDLYTLQSMTKDAVEDLFPEPVWVKAEISAVSVKTNGHCYLELSQSDERGLVARSKAVIWRNVYLSVSRYFQSVTGSPLREGLSVLVRVRVSFHEIYGLSLVIDDIDPQFTLGDREQQKRQTVARLEEEGLMDLQKELTMVGLPYYLAVISTETAAGYGDFRRHLLENEYGFVYQLDLFEATMQGNSAPSSISSALESVAASPVRYDAVLILRGGGSELDLACFDDYDLAAAIARCPVPVFTAIGHDRDYHVADMVANKYVKTPTALADLVLDCTVAEDERISYFDTRLRLAFSSRLSALASNLELVGSRLLSSALRRVDKAESSIQLLETKISATDPRNVLRRGFSLILDDHGVRFSSAASRGRGEKISVLMPDGRLDCTVDSVKVEKAEE